MRLTFIVNPIYINDGWSPWDTRIGGSEECVVQWAKELSKKHHVEVFHNGKHGRFGKVQYRPHEDYTPGDVTINVNYPQFKPQGKTIYYTSLTENPDVSMFDAVCCLSEFAKYNTSLPYNAEIIPPGYDEEQIYPEEKIAKQCFYGSSPDRGLETMLEAWPKVHAQHPDATLIVTYGGELNLPGVINLGEVDEKTMDDVYRTSDIWCHPCSGGELYCITGKKAQVAGCIPVIIPTMALSETVRRGYKVADAKDYAQSLIEVLNQPMEVRNIIRKDVIKHANAMTWQESTQKLLEIIEKVLQS